MIDAFMHIGTSFGLSASAGLNAYLPLLVVALMARYTNLITLNEPWDTLTNIWVVVVLVILLIIEVAADKIPAVDTANDIIQTFIRPVAGAILFAASASVIKDIHPAIALICGLLVAGGVHAAKATARPVVTGASGGLLNPVVSLAEDVVALVVSIISIVLPVLVVILMGVSLILLAWWVSRRRASASQV
jgi:hypothetical protein